MNQFIVNNTCFNKYQLRYLFVSLSILRFRKRACDVPSCRGKLDRIFITLVFWEKKMINIRDRRGRISSWDWRNDARSVTGWGQGARGAGRCEKPRGRIALAQPKTNHKLLATCWTADYDTRCTFLLLLRSCYNVNFSRTSDHYRHIFKKLLWVMTFENYELLPLSYFIRNFVLRHCHLNRDSNYFKASFCSVRFQKLLVTVLWVLIFLLIPNDHPFTKRNWIKPSTDS